MTCGACPSCGFDLERLEPFTIGNLEVRDDATAIFWKGRLVHLWPSHRLLVSALARDAGHVVRRSALSEAIGDEESVDPRKLLDLYLFRIRAAFKEIDPAFAMIETVRSIGVRWRAV